MKGRTLMIAALSLAGMVFLVDLRTHFQQSTHSSGASSWRDSLSADAQATIDRLSGNAKPAAAAAPPAPAAVHHDDPELSALINNVRSKVAEELPVAAVSSSHTARQPLSDDTPPPASRGGVRGASSSTKTTSSSTTTTAGGAMAAAKLKPAEQVANDGVSTQFKCYSSADWAELCVYSNLCWDGNKAVMFDDTQMDMGDVPRHFQVGDNPVGHHTFDVYPRPPKESKGLPRNTRAKAYYRHTNVLKGNTDVKITWTDDAMWIVEPEYRGHEVQHPFFWAHSTFAMWEAKHSNDTWGGVMPPIDRLYLPMQPNVDLGAWNLATLAVLKQPQTKLITQKETKEQGLSTKNLVCSRRGVITGHKPNVFSGIAPCYMYRQAVYSSLTLTGADRANSKDKYPPHHLVIWSRKGRRGFSNEADILKLVESYKIPYTLVTNHGSFKDQVELMSKAGVLLLAHGAAATNTIFQPHRSVLIEVFPYLRKRFGFGNLATTCGNFYMPLFTWDKDPTDAGVNDPGFTWKCEHRSAIDTNFEATCDQASKGGKIHVPLDVLERTLIDAFDTIGKRIYKNGIRKPRPTRPPSQRAETLDTWTDPWLDE